MSYRDRLLTSRKFRSWASRFPLTRPLARRRARQLFDICAGFVYSQILLACVRLDIFTRLADGPQSPADISTATGLDTAACERLLRATPEQRSAVTLLSGGTDGEDGTTTAAGAMVWPDLTESFATAHVDVSDYLRRNDAHAFFQPVDALLVSGPTQTNVCDVRVLLLTPHD